ncbi:type VII secretion integral membrane protein EccD [Amycolatopsis taiwanensis]|uniref:EccD-like transmembrane domain-containing protein n=1 Tax=Amycolatopsis taiwanensis TaxID=342230 RepID=A0A9W6VF42_9PSEU|nr:type VII secretion integral membrane protein EccD [Amycolatopsis taiwanensis]GLY65107.1 hypothetical protein Atai01_17260 [Amycolatopsis taiwanensis]
MTPTGLVRVTVATPSRRIDLELPTNSPLAELLPNLLQEGEHVADQGVLTGGWEVRRTDGSVLQPADTLAAHRVAEGEILRLAPTTTGFPRPVREKSPSGWGPRHTQWAGLAVGTGAILLCLLAVVWSGPPWRGRAYWALGLAALALAVAVVLTRRLRDTGAGTGYAAAALACAFTGGGLLFAGDGPLSALGAQHLLSAGAAVVLVALTGLAAWAGRMALLVAATVGGLLTMLGAGLCATGALSAPGAAAVVAGAGLAFSPWLEPCSDRLARLGIPVPPPGFRRPLSAGYATVVRADGLLTGMTVAIGVVTVPCQVVLARGGDLAGLVLAAVVTAGFVLRARRHRGVAQRAALLIAAGAGAVCLVADPVLAHRSGPLFAAGPVLVALAALAALAGQLLSMRHPRPRLGGRADLLDVIVVVAVVPAVCAAIGLYAASPTFP